MYRRRSYRRYPRVPKKNYQIMRPWWIVQNATPAGYQTVIDPAEITGVRKTKNFSIEFGYAERSGGTGHPNIVLVWALVYVPKGYTPNNLGGGGNTMYNPTNNVIMSGIYDSSDPGNTARRFTRLSRLLREGDGIALVYQSTNTPSVEFRVQITYAIAL